MTTDETTPAAAAPPASSNDGGLDARVLIVAGVVVLGAIMSILDITVVSVAQQVFQREFDVTAAQSAWTMTGYTLALAAVIPLTGWAADRFGTKRLYLLAIAFFAAGSALCALSGSLPVLVTFRIIQGLGGGMLMPLGMTILTRAAGPERIGRVMAVLGIPMLLGPICGPILGGWLIDVASWHWIFLINVPIGIVALVYAWIVLEPDVVEPSESFDFIGMILLSPGLALLLYGISSIPETGTLWATKAFVPALVGAILVIAFVPWALNRNNKHPLIDLRLFKHAAMTIAVVSMSLFCIAFFGASLLFPQYYQFVRGEDSLHAGLLLAPQGIGAMLTMPIAGIMADKRGPGKVVLVGVVLIIVGLFMYSTLDESTSYLFLCAALFVQGLGMGATMMPIFSAALAALKAHEVARGSTLMNIVQQVAASIGTAIFTVLLTNGIKDHATTAGAYVGTLQKINPDAPDPSLVAKLQALAPTGLPDLAGVFSHTFVIAACLVVLVLIPAFFLPRSKTQNLEGDAAPVMMH